MLRIRFEQLSELLPHFFCIYITRYDEREVVRDVARLVILHHLFLCELIVDFNLADHREAVWMSLIRGGKKKQPSHAIGIIHAHGEFAPDHFLFFPVFFRRQSRIHHRIGQNVERGGDTILRHIDPKNGAIEGRVGVNVAADVLNLLCDLVGRSRFGALKKHVLENVRQARAKMRVFIDAPCGTPRLHTCHRRAVIFLHDDRQPIWQHPFLCRARRKRDYGRAVRPSGIQIGSPKHNRDQKRHARRESHHTGLDTGNSEGGFAACGFVGANGFTKASSKS